MDPYRYVWHLLVSALVLPHDSAQYFSTDLLSCFTKALCCGGHRSKYSVQYSFFTKILKNIFEKMMSNQQHKRRRIDSESTATTAAPDTTDTNDVTATNAAGGGGGASSSSSSKGHKVVPERVSWVVHPEEPDELEAGTPSDTLAALLLLLSELPA